MGMDTLIMKVNKLLQTKTSDMPRAIEAESIACFHMRSSIFKLNKLSILMVFNFLTCKSRYLLICHDASKFVLLKV